MLKPPPPIKLPSPEERREAFNRWMYQFWEWAGDGGAGTAQIFGSAPIAVATGTGSFTVSHNTSGVAAGTYGNSTSVAQVVVDARGHVTSGTTVAISTTAPRVVEGTTPIAVATSTAAFTVSHNTSGVAAGTFGGAAGVPRFDLSALGHVLSGTSFPITGTAPIVVETGTSSFGVAHGTSGVLAGTFGMGTAIPQLVVDARGHVTSGTALQYHNVVRVPNFMNLGTLIIPSGHEILFAGSFSTGTAGSISNAGQLSIL